MHPYRLAAIAILLAAPALTAQGKNLLFYGNSFSFFNGGVAQLVRAMAIEAGFPAPTYQERLVAGQDLYYHATNPTQIAAISNFLPPGQTWDYVVMQGISTEATQVLGNPANFIANAITILGNVRNHSPAAKGVMYQTFARAQGHSFYPTYFPNPWAMHSEVRTNYRNAIPALEAVYGAGAAANAAAGDCAALREFSPSIYFTDLHHPAKELTIMAAACLFTAMYQYRACDITPNFSLPGPLGLLLNNYGLNADDWRQLAGTADTCAAPALRRYPGSGDQLLIETGTQPGLLTGCPRNLLTIGNLLQVRVSSRNGFYDNTPALLLGDLFPTGQPPVPTALFPELAVDLGTLAVLQTAPSLGNPLTLSVPLPFTIPGVTILVQGLAWAPSIQTGRPITTTDGHEFVFQ